MVGGNRVYSNPFPLWHYKFTQPCKTRGGILCGKFSTAGFLIGIWYCTASLLGDCVRKGCNPKKNTLRDIRIKRILQNKNKKRHICKVKTI